MAPLKVKILCETRDFFGVWTLRVEINAKQYDYILSSEYIVRQIKKYVKAGRYGKALATLNRFKEVNHDYSPYEGADGTTHLTADTKLLEVPNNSKSKT
ncbi:hypothetical protein KO465_04895 [Candidatus Micrarchaeota archaeon]|nr:hypothetical protein [Candidatus Micrarchaeota archaeon]